MAKALVIVESPAKARTIQGFLGRDRFTVKASLGHIRDLPSSAKQVPKGVTDREVRRLGIDVNNHFQPVYVVVDKKKDVVKELKAALADAEELYLATDEDREGEAISWHVLEVLKPSVPVKRLVFHEITQAAIEDALENWRQLDMKLVEAQEGRRVLDRLFGYEMSLVARRRAGGATSAGRVQSVAARLVVERERARMAFHSAGYWDLEGTFRAHDSDFTATLVSIDGHRLASGRDFDPATGRLAEAPAEPGAPTSGAPSNGGSASVVLLDQARAQALTGALREQEFRVASVETRSTTERPKAPFTTSTLQQEAGRKLGFSAGRTMAVAQRLYENGYITYMRTDSTALSDQALTAARDRIGALYGADYLPDAPRRFQSKVKNAQEAHEAVRPAGDAMRVLDDISSELDADERRLYELIWKRTVACQMADARIRRVTARLEASASSGETVLFQATGRTIEFPGYLRAYVEGADDPEAELEDREALLPELADGDAVACREVRPSEHATQPPARYTEASLVKELEERGIGRPSTYAAVIDTLLRRDYVWKKGSALVPTWTSFAKLQLLERHFPHLIDYEFTATMEEALDAIARGEGEAEKWLHTFWFGNGQAGLKDLVDDDHLATIDPAEVNAVPIGRDANGHEILVRVWNNGASVVRGEERAPLPVDLAPDELTIERATDIIAKGAGGPRVLGNDPDTGLPVLVLTGRFGPFVQLGEFDDGDASEKPKRASLFETMAPDTVELDDALRLLALPRIVGVGGDGLEISAQNGRYGPYLKKESESRSLEHEEQLFTVTLSEAEALFAMPKQRRGRAKPPLAELGPHPSTGKLVRVLDGRYGPYVTDGEVNASVPRGVTPETIDLDQAVELLAERAARGPATRKTTKTTRKTKKASKSTKKASKSTKRTTKRSGAPSLGTKHVVAKGARRRSGS